MASVELDRFEQTHRTALVNNGFDGLNHLSRISPAVFRASVEAPKDPAAATLVDGRLPKVALSDALKTDNLNNANSMVALWAHTKFRTSQAGSVNLTIEGAASARLWVAGKAVSAGSKVSVELPAGTYDLLVKLHPKTLPKTSRCLRARPRS